jgi:hypothetical protein
MTALQYVGLGFAAALVIFLMVAYFASERVHRNQFAILRFLCALCGAFAGALITGSALFDLNQTWTGGKLAVSGTAGFALFFAVWYGFGRIVPPPPDRFNMSVPSGSRFQTIAVEISKHDKSVVSFVGFSDAELAAPLSPQVLETDTVADALLALRSMVASAGLVREYDVEFSRPTYTLRIRT